MGSIIGLESDRRPGRTNQLLQIAKLVTVFDVFGDESDALNALMKDVAPATEHS